MVMSYEPIKKPTKADRRRSEIDYTRLALSKGAPDRDKAYLDFVRGQVCATWGHDCGGVTEAAHVFVLGKSIKASDYFTIPLCTVHHRESHDAGILTFQLNHGVNVWEVAARLLVSWIRRQR
jgi:hypothetical protein